MSEENHNRKPGEDPIRHHVYDGIAEFDRRLPNWWLATFYASIAFAIGYWFFDQLSDRDDDFARVDQGLQQLEAARLADGGAPRDNESLLRMSQNEIFVSAGRNAFMNTCASCHGVDLKGGVGPNLTDDKWLHGSSPLEVLEVVDKGVLAKGMPAWGPVLGTKRVNELVAFILSQQPAPKTSGL